MPTVGINIPREEDLRAYRENARAWAESLGVRPRGRGAFSAYVRHLLEQGRRSQEKKNQ